MNWLATLNESQLEAVIHPNGPLFVVAGAGTGKTRTLTAKNCIFNYARCRTKKNISCDIYK